MASALSFHLPTKSLLTDKAIAIYFVFGVPFHPNQRIDSALLQHPQLQVQTPTRAHEDMSSCNPSAETKPSQSLTSTLGAWMLLGARCEVDT